MRWENIEAESYFQRALKIREKVLGADHPDVGATLSGLAAVYQDTGDYAEAEELYKRAQKIAEKAHGPESLAASSSMQELARLSSHQRDYATADPLYQLPLPLR